MISLGGNILTGNIDSATFIGLSASGSITTAALDAGTNVFIRAGGDVTTGDIAAATGLATFDVGPGNPVEIFSGGSINSGDISTDGYVGLYAEQNITVGAITADHDIIALAGGNASFGAIDTPERFILAGYDNYALIDDGESFDPEQIFNFFPLAPTGGNATFAGSSDVGDSFTAFVGGNASLQSLFVGSFADIYVGGLFSLTGALNSGFGVTLGSNDIDIAQGATIATNFISFYSFNPTGMFIGDNISLQGGYRLSQAELNRVDAVSYGFEALTDFGAGDLMVLGDLVLDVSSQNEGSGAYFAIDSDGETDAQTGIIRVTGDAEFIVNSFSGIDFESETFEIDAATGSVSLVDGSGALAGLLYLEAQNIFIASGDILARLEENPQYDGFRDDLNAPAAVQRPEGVIRAGAIELGDDDLPLQNLLVQNTGTQETPAGFLVTDLIFADTESEVEIPAGSLNMVINGQIQTESGTLTGSAVREALVAEFGTEIFVEGSTINGCTLAGVCGDFGPSDPSPPPSAIVTPTQIAILTSDPLGETNFGNEGDIDDNIENDASDLTSPIDAPQPLFDTRPLNGDEDVNEPISGAGNPSLYGLTSDEDDEDEEEEGENGEAKPAGEQNGRSGGGQ